MNFPFSRYINSNKHQTTIWSFTRTVLPFILLIPAVVLVYLTLMNYNKIMTESLYQTKLSQARLAATVVEEKLNSLVKLGNSYASRRMLIKYIEGGHWETGADMISDLLHSNTEFERMVLYDTNAIIRADVPNANVIGQSRAEKEWFREFRKTWKPFVSGVYQRTAEPRNNVISIVVPIYADNHSPSKTTSDSNTVKSQKLGILQLQLNLEYFHTWTNINVGLGGIIYIVDQYGRIVHHPKFDNHSKIIDFSLVGIVQKMHGGKHGVAQNYNEVEMEDRIAGFQGVKHYGWGVVVTQPVSEAFREMKTTLRTLRIICGLLLCLAVVLVFAIRQFFVIQQNSSEMIRQKNIELETANIGLKDALDNNKVLKGLLPICAYCKKVRDDSGYWQKIEIYVRDNTDADFSHGICPDCVKKYYPEIKE